MVAVRRLIKILSVKLRFLGRKLPDNRLISQLCRPILLSHHRSLQCRKCITLSYPEAVYKSRLACSRYGEFQVSGACIPTHEKCSNCASNRAERAISCPLRIDQNRVLAYAKRKSAGPGAARAPCLRFLGGRAWPR